MFSFTNPDHNVAELDLQGDERVVVFGSGAGGHSFALMKALKNGGSVVAIDVRQELLERVQKDAERFHTAGGALTTKCVDYQRLGGTQMPDGSCDVVVIPNTLFAAEHKDVLLQEAYRIVRAKGKVLIIDWRESFGGMGPQEEHVVPKEKAQELAESAGFTCERGFMAGANHYGLLCRK